MAYLLFRLPSIAEFGLRDAGVGESRNQPKWLRKLKTAGLDDCVKDPMAAKDAIGVENQAGCTVDSLRKSSETLRAGNRHGRVVRGIMSVFLDPYRLRRVAMLARW